MNIANTNHSISRRNLLATAAAGGAAAVFGSGIISAFGAGFSADDVGEYWTKTRIDNYLCTQIHRAKSEDLAKFIADDDIDMRVKNAALKSTSCPCCNTRISPAA